MTTMHRFELRVRYGDTDQMGVAYYANYLRWFEIGRAEMLRSLGRTYRSVEEGGVRLPVIEAHVRYLQPARYDEVVAIETGVLASERVSVCFGYRIRRENGEPIAHGWTVHCFLDRDGRPCRPPEFLARLIEIAPRSEGVVGPAKPPRRPAG
jgi:acyl-CoA thioester hydrolase